jgi:hypothetical protein
MKKYFLCRINDKDEIVIDVNNVLINKHQYFMPFFMLKYLIFSKLNMLLFYMKKKNFNKK